VFRCEAALAIDAGATGQVVSACWGTSRWSCPGSRHSRSVPGRLRRLPRV